MEWILLTLLVFFQIRFYKHPLRVNVIVFFVMAGGLYFLPNLIIGFYFICFVMNHPHFLGEEKGFTVILVSLWVILIIGSFYRIDVLFYGLNWIFFVLLEYLLLRILKREENKTIIYQNKLMKQQMDEIQQIYMTMREWRHDYHNHLQSLKGYLNLQQVSQMKDYLNDLETELDSIDTLYHSGNLQIDAILNAKLAIAEQAQIKITCDAQVPPQLHVTDIDLCVILGNLLDNAIESNRKIELIEQRFIRVYLGRIKKQLYLSITNATSETVKQRTDHYFSTKRGDHGYGLKRVDQLVVKYDGYLNRQNEPGVFATEIVLPL